MHVFVKNRAALEVTAPAAAAAVTHDALLWISYPKQSGKLESNLNRDVCWRMMQDIGWRAVMQIALDDTWSAPRFRSQDIPRGKG
ncbi:MAG: hypothetical protein JXN59_19480 [Anaerolineae bacterium]|nr:hypothetical protein [Anaerolineae bacterium]